MRKVIPAILIVLFIGTHAYSQTANPTSGCASLIVEFDGAGSIYDWESGDGQISNDTESPTFIYPTPGTYTAVVKDATSGAVVRNITIEVLSRPSAAINSDVIEGCVPFDVNFDYTLSSSAVTYTAANWVFGDGQTTTNSTTTAANTYSTSGNYTVTLQLETGLAGCEITTSVSNMVAAYDAPVVDFEYTPEFACTPPATVDFTNLTTDALSLSYSWDFGDGAVSTDENPSHTYVADGTYAVELTATNARGCVTSQTQYYTINRPTAVIDAPDTLCIDLSYTFSELTGGNATWDFSAASGVFVLNDADEFEPISSTGRESIEVYFKQAGSQDVTLELNSSCGNETITKTIFIQQLSIDPFLDKEYSCLNPVDVLFDVNTDAQMPTYDWQFSDGTDAATQSTTRTYFNESDTVEFGINNVNLDTTYIVITQPATATRGICYDTALIDFEHYPLNAKVEPGSGFTNLCEGTTLTFTDSINVSNALDPITGLPFDEVNGWRWQVYDDANNQLYAESGTSSTVSTLGYNFTASGDYNIYLEASTNSGCTDTSYALAVTIGDPLVGGTDFDFETFDIGGALDTDFCLGDSIVYSVTNSDPRIDGFHFYSDNRRIFHQPDDSTVRWLSGAGLGVQDVTLEVDVDGCISSLTKPNYLTVSGAVAEITYASDCGYDYEFESTSQSFPSASPTLLWTFQDDASTSTSGSLMHTYGSSGDYWATLTAQDGGCTADKDSVLVSPRLTVADVTIKNAVACGGNEIVLDASATVDARDCRGLTFRFPTFDSLQRPITTFNTDTVAVTIPDFDELNVTEHYFQLISTDDNGCKDTVNSDTISTSFIQVGANLSDTAVTCKGIELTFSDTTSSSGALTDWEWRIWSGDLSLTDTISGDAAFDTISFTFLEEPVDVDSFFVALEVTGSDGCVGGVGDTLFVLPYTYLNGAIRTTDDNNNNNDLCASDTAFFRGRDRRGQDLHFAWDFGDGQTDTTTNANDFAENVYAVGGDYTVSMYYFQPSTGCVDTLTRTITVESAPDVGFETDVDNLSAICAGEIIQFSDTSTVTTGSITGLLWDLGNGETGTTTTYSTLFDKGSYDVTLEASTDNGCTNSFTRTMIIVGPEGDINIDDDSVCPGDTVAFNIDMPVDVDSVVWFFGDGFVDSSNVVSVDHRYLSDNIPSSYSVTATFVLYSNDGCELPADTVINFYQVEAGFEVYNQDGLVDNLFCIDETVQLSDTSINADVFDWDLGDGESATESDPSYSYSTQGTYTIQQVVENSVWGCSDTLRSTIVIEGLPDGGLVLSADTLCLGETLTASINPPNDSSSYLWSTGDVTSSISLDPVESFLLSLTETNYAGCVSSLDSMIEVIQPYLYNDWDTTIQEGKSARLPILLDSAFSFELSPVDGLSCLNCNYPVVSPLEDVVYNLRISDTFGCFDDQYTLTVFVIPPSFISMPESFTPNGDGVNDEIFVKGWFLQELREFKVFNRWGEVIFSTNDINVGWDGTFNGKIQQTDIYVYKIVAVGVDGNIVQKEGYINLIK